MPLQVAAYKGRSVISKAIRWQTRSQYSHVGILLPDNSVIEAWHAGGVLHNAALFTRHSPKTIVDIYDVEGEYDEAAIIKFLNSQLGKKYDFSSVARFLSRRSSRADDKWFCSELVHAGFAHGDLLLLHGYSSTFSPRDIVISPRLRFNRTVINGE